MSLISFLTLIFKEEMSEKIVSSGWLYLILPFSLSLHLPTLLSGACPSHSPTKPASRAKRASGNPKTSSLGTIGEKTRNKKRNKNTS